MVMRCARHFGSTEARTGQKQQERFSQTGRIQMRDDQVQVCSSTRAVSTGMQAGGGMAEAEKAEVGRVDRSVQVGVEMGARVEAGVQTCDSI